FVYEAAGTSTPAEVLAEGGARARVLLERNAIPAEFLTADSEDLEAWLAVGQAAIDSLLTGRGS
ncbi:MAG TPA: hypothetical protein VKG62_07380, partial [Solirubrobacteraceae bacterium]|nr:hypothetical protein [Solirubrobacteraceae bacterium]